MTIKQAINQAAKAADGKFYQAIYADGTAKGYTVREFVDFGGLLDTEKTFVAGIGGERGCGSIRYNVEQLTAQANEYFARIGEATI